MPKNLLEFIFKGKDDVSKDFKKTGGEVQGLGSKLKAFATGPVGIAAGAITAMGAALVGITAKVAKWGDDLAKTSKRIGVSTEDLSTLSFAAERSGASFASLQTGLRTLARNANEASEGTKAQADAFATLGISVTDAQGNLKSMDQLLLESADSFKGMTNDTQAAALAQELFGRSGLELLPLLKEGSAGIKELQNRARDLGVEFSEKSAKDAEAFVDAQTDLKEAFKGVTQSIGVVLMPVLTTLINWFVEGIIKVRKWVGSMRDAFHSVQEAAGDATGNILKAAAFLADKWLLYYQKIGGAIDWVSEKVTGHSLNISGRIQTMRAGLDSEVDEIVAKMKEWGEETGATEEQIVESFDNIETKAGTMASAVKEAVERPKLPIVEFNDEIALSDEVMGDLGDTIEDVAVELPKWGAEARAAKEKAKELADEGIGGLIGSVQTLTHELGISNDALSSMLDWINKISSTAGAIDNVISRVNALSSGGIPGGGLLGKVPGLGSLAKGAGGLLRGAGAELLHGAGGLVSGAGNLIGAAGGASGILSGGIALAGTGGILYGASRLIKDFLDSGGPTYAERYAEEQASAERIAARAAERRAERAAGFGREPDRETWEDILARGGGQNTGSVTVNYTQSGPLMGNQADALRFAREIRDKIAEVNAGEVS